MRPTHAYGWERDGVFFLSLTPRDRNGPFNRYETPTAALQEAARRGLKLVWEDPAVIDAYHERPTA